MIHPPFAIPDDLRQVSRIFRDAGHQCWLVGGAVRDGLMGRKSEDFDLATDARPRRVMRLFRRVLPTGIAHGTVTILWGPHQFQTTTFRSDGQYSDGRRPDTVSFGTDINPDLARRDFSINAIAWNLQDDRIHDPQGGCDDLKRRLIRAIGSPADRFREDSLRAVRACRFAAQLGFEVDAETLKAMALILHRIPDLAKERLWEEVKKILLSPKPSRALNLFRKTDLLAHVFPELDSRAEEGASEELNLFTQSLEACDRAPADNLALRTAALLHGIVWFGNAAPPERRLQTVENLFRRFNSSNAERDRVMRLLRCSQFSPGPDWTDADIRRFISRAGRDILDDLMTLRPLLSAPPGGYWLEFTRRIDGVLAEKNAISLRDLAVDGRGLMDFLNLPPGPLVGNLLDDLLGAVLENPDLNEEGKLLERAKVLLTALREGEPPAARP